jgi:hypothetical protein
LDSNGTLVGLVLTTGMWSSCDFCSVVPKCILTFLSLFQGCGNRVDPSTFTRISSFSDWILEATCALTDDNASQLCPDMVCPPSDRVFGYPWADVPDASGLVKTFHGYQPKRVAQSPPAGTPFNSTTTVLVLAVDESDKVAMCAWTLDVPEMRNLYDVYEELPRGTYERRSSFPSHAIYDCFAVYLTAQLYQNLDANATVEVTTGYNETLTLTSSDLYGELWFQKPYNPYNLSNVTVVVTGMKNKNAISAYLFGQVRSFE